jgi:dolichyl-phosphate beta-glucosyltransferase
VSIDGFAFDVETLYLAHKLGYRVCEVPVVWLNDEHSTVSMVMDPFQMFLDVMWIRVRHWGIDRNGA